MRGAFFAFVWLYFVMEGFLGWLVGFEYSRSGVCSIVVVWGFSGGVGLWFLRGRAAGLSVRFLKMGVCLIMFINRGSKVKRVLVVFSFLETEM